MIIGLISGAMGPFSNAPIDTIKTRSSAQFICDLPVSLHSSLDRSAKSTRGARQVRVPAHRGHRAGHVAARGRQVVLQGHYSACPPRRAGPGDCVRGVRARAQGHRDDAGVERRRALLRVGSAPLGALFCIYCTTYWNNLTLRTLYSLILTF